MLGGLKLNRQTDSGAHFRGNKREEEGSKTMKIRKRRTKEIETFGR